MAERLAAGSNGEADVLGTLTPGRKALIPSGHPEGTRLRRAGSGEPSCAAARMAASILFSSSTVARLRFSLIWFPPVNGRRRPSLPARCETLTPAPPRPKGTRYPALCAGRGSASGSRRDAV